MLFIYFLSSINKKTDFKISKIKIKTVLFIKIK
jgi:hypothetical protein